MKVYTLRTEQELPISIEEAWNFFSTPLNLNEITPKEMKFNILTDIEGKRMYPGMIINYIVTPIANIPMRWTTEIKHVEHQKYFVDEQRFGPYAMWHHKHFFEPTDKGVKMVDQVDYALPLGWFGQIARELFVQNKLNEIFDYRFKTLEEKFGRIK